MMKNKRNIFWYLVASGFLILFSLVLISSIIDIGEKLSFNIYVEIAFYVLCAILIFALIINPIRIIVFSPSLSIVTTLDKDSLKAHRVYKEVSKNIIKNNCIKLTDEERHALLH